MGSEQQHCTAVAGQAVQSRDPARFGAIRRPSGRMPFVLSNAPCGYFTMDTVFENFQSSITCQIMVHVVLSSPDSLSHKLETVERV